MTLRKHGITGLRKEVGEGVGEGGRGGGAAGRGMTGRRGAARAEVPAREGRVRGVGEGWCGAEDDSGSNTLVRRTCL